MLKLFRTYSLDYDLYRGGSTGGVASTIALSMLKSKIVEGVLISRRYFTFVADSKADLITGQGSIYEDFIYYIPDGVEKLAQIGKPCDICSNFKCKISLFCNSIYSSNFRAPITKSKLRSKNKFSRYLMSKIHRPTKCYKCIDHVGLSSDISVGDSQINPKINYVAVRTELGLEVYNQCVESGLIHSEPVGLNSIVESQPYLLGRPSFKWMVKKLLN